ncbi:hypothetical protein [Caldimonas tepidiphila]|uniref:hypothetical protein n=1 Tax=Caldimonas tepidiphila TaxID=2315841 RepID=UPI000E5AFEB4|nr:hypothetical protein [Caldimonas tepidiphila]
MFDSAEDRIQFMQIVDALEQGQGDTLPADVLDRYVQQGLMARDGGAVKLTDEGRREYDKARNERQMTG